VFERFWSSRRKLESGARLVPEHANDVTIIEFLAAREPRAMELVYDRWGATIYAIALRIVGNPAEAEKVVLEGCLTLWRHPELALQHCNSVRAYLCAVVAYQARLRHLTSPPFQTVSLVEVDTVREAAWPTPREASPRC
jgi:DNA-directed RNA polymerase specialized sigma24 family protein